MGDDVTAEALAEQLFADEGLNVYAILDGASVDGLLMRMWELRQPNVCLFPGELEPDMAEVAPYLVPLKRGEKFTTWLLSEGWGMHWGIFASRRRTRCRGPAMRSLSPFANSRSAARVLPPASRSSILTASAAKAGARQAAKAARERETRVKGVSYAYPPAGIGTCGRGLRSVICRGL